MVTEVASGWPRTTIDLVRHTDVHNPASVFYGRLPRFRLSELGRRQAVTTAARLAAAPVDAVYTSPMLRARQTAAIIAAVHPRRPIPRQTRLLIEVGSSWQGRPSTDLDAIGYDFYRYAGDGDETIAAVFERMARLIRQLVRRHTGDHVVCISHADPIAVARAGFAGQPLVITSIRGLRDYPAKGSISRLVFRAPDHPPSITYLPPE